MNQKSLYFINNIILYYIFIYKWRKNSKYLLNYFKRTNILKENIVEYLYKYYEHSIIKYNLSVTNIVGINTDTVN